MSKLATVSVGLSTLIFAGLIPVMEINSTHLFNPEWPEHARLHEAWQLLTNAGICALALACVWTQRAPRLGITLALIVCGAFLTAWALGASYGGSMLHTDGTQMAVAGVNVAVIIVAVVTGLLTFSWFKQASPL
ncbi:MAG: hypothetical protein AB8G23_05510 [Myxococcota bacterium]